MPQATEELLWGDNLVFKIGGKMFAVLPLDPGSHCLALKVGEEEFAEWCEREGVVPAPHLGRCFWIALEHEDAIGVAELKQLIRSSYDMVRAKLPRKTREQLDGVPAQAAARTRRVRQKP
ncbi:MAG: MmcQ/YjbR family DNA-binding protein [Acidobacteria bacterium]|nr:MmcQ/YjbR family DNA-binding protein [Acidobacteriota bacterium]